MVSVTCSSALSGERGLDLKSQGWVSLPCPKNGPVSAPTVFFWGGRAGLAKQLSHKRKRLLHKKNPVSDFQLPVFSWVLSTCGAKLPVISCTITDLRSVFFFVVCGVHTTWLEDKTNLSHDGLNPFHVPCWWVNNPSLPLGCGLEARKKRHRRIKKQRRYERLAATSQLSLW